MKCSNGQRFINPECHLDFVRIDDLMRSLLLDARTCSECSEVVNLYAFPINDPVGPGRKFDKAAVVGCEKIIDSVIERFVVEFDFAGCFEGEKSQNVLGASH